MKRVYSGMLVFVFIFIGLLLADKTCLAEIHQGDGFYYELNAEGGAILTKFTGDAVNAQTGLMVIPEQIDGHKVVAIGESFAYGKDEIRELSIPGTVKELGYRCFVNADNLTKLTFRGEGLETIGERAFYGCPLTAFSIPSTVKKVDSEAFGRIAATSITMPASVEIWGDRIFSGSYKVKTIVFEDGFTTIPENILGINSADQIVIPASVSKIVSGAFSNVDVKSVTIHGKNTILEEGAFFHVNDAYCYRDSKAYDFFVNAWYYKTNIHIMGPYLEKETFEIKVGETAQLKVINRNGTVSWTSSNSKIATVDSNGKVKAINPGKVAVTAVVENTKLTAEIQVKDLMLDKKKDTVTVGFQTKLKLAGGNKVKWSSSNKKIATVSSKGVVKGNKKGTATITATCNNRKYKCKVTVKENKRTLDSYPTSPNQYRYNMIVIGIRTISQDQKGNLVLKGHIINTYPQTANYIENLTVRVKREGKIVAQQSYGRLNVNVGKYSSKAITLIINKKNVKKKVDLRTGNISVSYSGGKVYGR